MGTVTSFKYLGGIIPVCGSKPEVLSRIEQATAALTKLKPVWRDNNLSLGSKVKLLDPLSSLYFYACESLTLTAELEKRTKASEMRCYRRLLYILPKDHITNEEVRRKIQAAVGEYDELLTVVKKRKPRLEIFWSGKVISIGRSEWKKEELDRSRGRKTILKSGQRCALPASSTKAAVNRTGWKGVVAKSSVVPRRPSKVME